MASTKFAAYFNPVKVGKNELKHRIVMAPLTRYRNDDDLCPTELSAEYYTQRATKGGLLISEAIYISPETIADNHGPGIWLPKHVDAWKKVTSAVHAKGGLISCQLWHVGRHAHESFSEHHLVKGTGYSTCWAPSAIALNSTCRNMQGEFVPNSTPKAYTLDMIPRVVQDYVHAAKNAIEAGFDYVELHSAHGYLPQQFFSVPSNSRDDEYAGSLKNRFRFLDEVLDALTQTVGKERLGIRVSPHNSDEYSFNCPDENPVETFTECMEVINKYAPSYVLFSEPRWNPKYTGEMDTDQRITFPATNGLKYGPMLKHSVPFGAGGFTPISGSDCIEAGTYPVISFGRWFISNPDIVERIKHGYPLNRYERNTFYTPNEVGYTDYPTFPQVLATLGFTEEDAKNPETMKEIIEKSKATPYPLIDINTLGINTSISSL